MNNKYTCILAMAGVLSLLSTSCMKDLGVGRPATNPEDYFDFKTRQHTDLTIDYGFTHDDYVVLCELYDQYPLTEGAEGQIVKKAIEPVYRGATDGTGKLSAQIQLPAYLTKVWLYSDYPGTLSPVEITIDGGTIRFDQHAYIQHIHKKGTRAVAPNGFVYPDEWKILGEWDQYGTPAYLDPQRTLPAASTLYNIKEIYDKATNATLQSRHPEFFESGLSASLDIVKPTKVYLVFIKSTAAWNSPVGYYAYPTGEAPKSAAEVERIMAFPSATPYLKNTNNGTVRGALVAGDRVQLKYWDGTQFQEEFPVGVSIGWWLEGMGFQDNNGKVAIRNNGQFSRFSADNLNADGKRHAVALLDSKTQRIVAIGFEDNSDMRYNDATFYIEVEEEGSIGESGMPVLPDEGNGPTDEQNCITTEGFLLFEDLWPSRGDYDMNDVMIKYNCSVYKHILNNAVYKVVNEFVPYHGGGQIQSGFGFQLTGLSPEAVRKVSIEGETQSRFMEGQSLEPGQTWPTIVLFDNARMLTGRKYTTTIELNDAPESLVTPPYNPFIIVEADQTRGREVHLPKMTPTDKMDPSYFGCGDDGSKPQQGLYYVYKNKETQYPFALNIIGLQEMPIPAENVRIDDSYPKFRSWVESGGKNNKDWYLYPAAN